MTEKHADRANGDSFFTVKELLEIDWFLAFCTTRSNRVESKNSMNELRKKINQEIEYIKSTKGEVYAIKQQRD